MRSSRHPIRRSRHDDRGSKRRKRPRRLLLIAVVTLAALASGQPMVGAVLLDDSDLALAAPGIDPTFERPATPAEQPAPAPGDGAKAVPRAEGHGGAGPAARGQLDAGGSRTKQATGGKQAQPEQSTVVEPGETTEESVDPSMQLGGAAVGAVGVGGSGANRPSRLRRPRAARRPRRTCPS